MFHHISLVHSCQYYELGSSNLLLLVDPYSLLVYYKLVVYKLFVYKLLVYKLFVYKWDGLGGK